MHSQRIAERKNTPPVQTGSEGIETVWKKARFAQAVDARDFNCG
jgi:hypothetical protein